MRNDDYAAKRSKSRNDDDCAGESWVGKVKKVTILVKVQDGDSSWILSVVEGRASLLDLLVCPVMSVWGVVAVYVGSGVDEDSIVPLVMSLHSLVQQDGDTSLAPARSRKACTVLVSGACLRDSVANEDELLPFHAGMSAMLQFLLIFFSWTSLSIYASPRRPRRLLFLRHEVRHLRGCPASSSRAPTMNLCAFYFLEFRRRKTST